MSAHGCNDRACLTRLHSPNSLAERGKIDKAKRVLQSVRGVDDVDVEFQDIIDAVDEVGSGLLTDAPLPHMQVHTHRYPHAPLSLSTHRLQAREYSKNPLVIFKRRFRPQLAFSIIIPICQQMTGISTCCVFDTLPHACLHNTRVVAIPPLVGTCLPPDAIMFFSPLIFKSLGFGDSAALIQTVLIGAPFLPFS